MVDNFSNIEGISDIAGLSDIFSFVTVLDANLGYAESCQRSHPSYCSLASDMADTGCAVPLDESIIFLPTSRKNSPTFQTLYPVGQSVDEG